MANPPASPTPPNTSPAHSAGTQPIDPNQYGNFQGSNIPGQDAAEKRANDLHELEMKDHKWRINARKAFGWIFVVLLILQNTIVFGLAIKAYLNGTLGDMTAVLTLIINGTLLETAFVIKIIVTWLFTDIPYHKK